MLQTLRRIVDLGVSGLHDPYEVRRVRLANVLSILTSVLSLPYIAIFLAAGERWLASSVLLILAGYAGVLLLNSRHHLRASRFASGAIATTIVVVYSNVLGEQSGTHYLFFVALMAPPFIIGAQDRWLLGYSIVLPVAGLMVVLLADFSLFGAPVISPFTQSLIQIAIVPTAAAVVLAGAVIFATTSERAQRGLDARNRDMERILDNVDQGLLSLTAEGHIDSEHSAVVEQWFGPIGAGMSFHELLFRVDEKAASWFELGWDMLIERLVPADVALEGLPKRLDHGGQQLELAYQLVGAEDDWSRVMVIISDVTDKLEREAHETREREMVAAFSRALRDRHAVRAFLREVGELVAATEQSSDVSEQRRQLHTIKGNTALFGLASVAERCHQLEEKIEETGEALSAAACEPLTRRWRDVSSQIVELIGDADVDRLFATAAEARELLERSPADQDVEGMRRVVASWLREPVEAAFARLAEEAVAMAERLGKGHVDVSWDAGGLRLERERWAPFWTELVHVVRNAIDHGFESREQRVESHKPERCQLRFEARDEKGRVVIVVRDDGRGVEWEAVAESAERLGLPCATRADLVAAIFAEGLTSRAQPTTSSGRGVGMAAVRRVTESLGGLATLESEPGEGTSVRFELPPDPERRPKREGRTTSRSQ